ncbi:MAG: CAP domain-containing protein [Candidatus Bathyarchaeia archaeon]
MRRTVTADSMTHPTGPSSPVKKIVAILLVAVILGFLLLNAPSPLQIFQRMFGLHRYPTYSHDELVNYALSLVNSDRSQNGQSNVSLSSVSSGQQHADDMLEHHYFSHWDVNGYKPYMRYTLAEGRGSVEENIAWYHSSGSFDAKEVLKDLEWQMMYNDSGSSNGHMFNILSTSHNRVNVGIALDRNNLYLVQDFENDYVQWSTFNVSTDNEVTMIGMLQGKSLSVKQMSIFYDSLPINLTSEQLEQPPHSDGYSAGGFVGMALPAGYRSPNGVTIAAQTWTQTGQALQILFDISPALDAHGKGVYTLYLQPSASTLDALTSYSIWYT